jgi:hypothetical protein
VKRGEFGHLVTFNRATTTTNDYGEEIGTGTELIEQGWARVRFGPAGEKREAAQESGSQAITLELIPTSALRSVELTDHILFDGSDWDIVEKAKLDRNLIRFTATRSV